MKFPKLLLLCGSLLAFGCFQRPAPGAYTTYTPVLMAKASLEVSIRLQAPLPISTPAKIYYKEGFIFISERFKGVHIIDNSDPTNPINKSFIAVPGCLDMAIKNNTLYVDNAIDLVTINLVALAQGKLQIDKRISAVFPEPAPPDGGLIPEKYTPNNRPKNTVIVDWKEPI